MTMDTVGRLKRVGIIPVSTVQNVGSALRLVDALVDGGLPAVEVTLRSDAAIDAIAAIARERHDVLLAAGTVLNADQAERAIDAGAQLIVSPGTFPDVVHVCLERRIPVLPGVATATEVGTALHLGATVLKFFPAEFCGGVAMLNAFAAVYPGVHFVPTGGISASNLRTYLSLPQVLACGGSWLVHPHLVAQEQYNRIVQMAREAVAIVRETAT